MSVSCGGGYCDCGDAEAWREHPHCSNHKVEPGEAEGTDPLSKLPPDLAARARVLLSVVTKYIFEMLTTDTLLTLPPDLSFKTPHRPTTDPGKETEGQNRSKSLKNILFEESALTYCTFGKGNFNSRALWITEKSN